jgi:hypothetical protein
MYFGAITNVSEEHVVSIYLLTFTLRMEAAGSSTSKALALIKLHGITFQNT